MPDLTPAAPENRAPEEISPPVEVENSSAERRIQGRFAPGSSGNPGGRPKSLRCVVEAAREATEAAIAVLRDALADPDPRVRIVAAKELLDRGWGRPGPAESEGQAPPTFESLLEHLRDRLVSVRELPDEALEAIVAQGTPEACSRNPPSETSGLPPTLHTMPPVPRVESQNGGTDGQEGKQVCREGR